MLDHQVHPTSNCWRALMWMPSRCPSARSSPGVAQCSNSCVTMGAFEGMAPQLQDLSFRFNPHVLRNPVRPHPFSQLTQAILLANRMKLTAEQFDCEIFFRVKIQQTSCNISYPNISARKVRFLIIDMLLLFKLICRELNRNYRDLRRCLVTAVRSRAAYR